LRILKHWTAPKKNGGAPRTQKQRGRNGGRGSAQPLPIQASIQIDKVIRFEFDPLSDVAITNTDLLDLLCMADTATSAFRILSAIRLRKIEIWSEPVAGGSKVSIEDEQIGITGVGGPSRVKEDTTLGVTRPAHLVWTPASGSIQAMWCSAGTGDAYLTLNATTAGFLDLHISMIVQDGETPVAVSAAVVAATVGQVYIRALDSTSAGLIVPVAYPTI